MMGILDFFRLNKEESKTIRKVYLEELSYEIENLFKELENKKKIIKENITKIVDSMIYDLREPVKILKSINLEQRREDERIKKIVSENLVFYISHVENLINELENISNLEAKDYILKIQFILDNFNKNSFKSYEKATILIGEEIGRVKGVIKNFNKEFIKIVQENEFIFIKMNSIEEFRELDNRIERLKAIKKGGGKQIKNMQELKEKLEKQKSIIEEDYYKFKQSEEFKKILMKEKESNEELNNFNNEIIKIKEKINVKFLLKYYHHNNKYSELLKSYKENFIETLENDENLEIVKLVEEAHDINIKKEILDLKGKNKKLKIRDNKPSETKLKIFEDRIKNADLEIFGLKEKEAKEMKKFEKFNKKELFLADEKINKAKNILGEIEILNLNERK